MCKICFDFNCMWRQDNTMFSCCCARVNFRWTPICGCYTDGALNRQTCDQKCLETHVRDPATINYFGLAKVRHRSIQSDSRIRRNSLNQILWAVPYCRRSRTTCGASTPTRQSGTPATAWAARSQPLWR